MKGDARPIHTQEQRKGMLSSLTFVDEVMNLSSMTTDEEYFSFVKKLKPDIIAITEGDPITEKKNMQAKQIGARLVIIPKIHTPSTSQLVKLLGLE